MPDTFTFASKASSEFGAYLAESTQFGNPARDVETIAVPGRSGDLTRDNGRYLNYSHVLKVYISSQVQARAAAMRAWLAAHIGYQRLEESTWPDHYRMAKFETMEADASDRAGGLFTLRFDCMPQRWLKSGETPVTIQSSVGAELTNPTLQDARPLIRVSGSSGTLHVGNLSCVITSINGYVDIDCEARDCYKGAVNCNQDVSIAAWPVLPPGETVVSWEGSIDSVVITPRWWTI